MSDKILRFISWVDNSMGNHTIRFRPEFEEFDWREARCISDEAVILATKLADQLEKDLKDQRP